MKTSGVYEIVNTITGDFYIGSSVDLERRKQHHFYESYWKYEPNKPLYKDMKQYRKENADSIKQQQKQYYNQQCLYKNEILSLSALSTRFVRQGIQYPTLEAKKYLIKLP